MEFIYKLLGRECKWKKVKRLSESNLNKKIVDLYEDKNKNGLKRYKKVTVSSSPVYNTNATLLDKKD